MVVGYDLVMSPRWFVMMAHDEPVVRAVMPKRTVPECVMQDPSILPVAGIACAGIARDRFGSKCMRYVDSCAWPDFLETSSQSKNC